MKKAYLKPVPACHADGSTLLRRLGLCVLVSLVAAPGAGGQTPPPAPDPDMSEVRQFSVSPGFRMELNGRASPGGSLRFTWYLPDPSPWIAFQLHGQMTRRKPLHNVTRRDDLYFGRVMAGYGRDDGPSTFAFLDIGQGTVKSEDNAHEVGESYRVWGIGLGVGYTLRKVSLKFDASIGGASRLLRDRKNRTSLGASLQYRVY